MRRLLCFAWLSLAACDRAPDGDAAPAAATAAVVDDRIECALAGVDQFARACTVERSGPTLTVRHPDGGFRRFQITDEGRGLVAADGASSATVRAIADARIEVTVDGDRYRLPATVKGR